MSVHLRPVGEVISHNKVGRVTAGARRHHRAGAGENTIRPEERHMKGLKATGRDNEVLMGAPGSSPSVTGGRGGTGSHLEQQVRCAITIAPNGGLSSDEAAVSPSRSKSLRFNGPR